MATREQYLIEQAQMAALGATRAQLSRVRPVVQPPVVASSPGGASPTLEQVFALGRVQPSYRSWISGAPNEIVRPNNAPQQGGGFSAGLRNAQGSW